MVASSTRRARASCGFRGLSATSGMATASCSIPTRRCRARCGPCSSCSRRRAPPTPSCSASRPSAFAFLAAPMAAPGTASWCGAASHTPACSAFSPTPPTRASTCSGATSLASRWRRRARSARSRDRCLATRHRLEANKTNGEVIGGPTREGLCLLQGLLVCGSCGRRLTVRYTGNGGLYPTYQCNWKHREALSQRACMCLPTKPVDDAMAERLVTAVTPLTIELALEALSSLEERDKAIAAQWRRRIDRARYDADLGERRYEAIDPANRLIASTLEQRWNDAMQRLLELETELANFERQTLRTITAEQKRQILQLATDFPRLWTAPTP